MIQLTDHILQTAALFLMFFLEAYLLQLMKAACYYNSSGLGCAIVCVCILLKEITNYINSCV